MFGKNVDVICVRHNISLQCIMNIMIAMQFVQSNVTDVAAKCVV